MGSSTNCFCWEIKKCVKIVGVAGIILSCISFLTVFYIPFSLALLFIYILVLKGLKNNRLSFLFIAQVLFGIILSLNFVIFLFCLIFIEIHWDFEGDSYDDHAKITNFDYVIIASVFIFIVIFLSGFTIFTIIVVQKLRNLLIFEYLESQLPPPEENDIRNFGGRTFPNIYSSDPNPSDNHYSTNFIHQMSDSDYININSSAPYYQR